MDNLKVYPTKHKLAEIKQKFPYLYKTIEKAVQYGLRIEYVTVKFNKDGTKIIQYKLHTKSEDSVWLTWTNQELLGYLERENTKENKHKKIYFLTYLF